MRFLSEIKRRNVHRMAALYVLAAWLIMQVAEVLIGLLHLPDWTGPAVLGLLALGFPIALVLSWFYELTSEGIAADGEVETGESATGAGGRRLDFVVIALLGAAVLTFAYHTWWTRELSVSSLALLPISAITADQEIGNLAEGMTYVLTGELGRIEGLRVPSVVTTRRYQATDKAAPEIAGELGVDALLEGSMQPFGDRLRIALHLVDGRTDRQLWSGNFERGIGELRTLLGEVAGTIAREIHISISPEVEKILARSRPTSPQAMKYWASGLHHLYALEPDSFKRALTAFQASVKEDPEFADGYAGIAQAYLYLGNWHGSEKPAQVLPLARSAVDTALRLDPYLSAAHVSLAQIHRYEWRWEDAEHAFRKGVRLNPSNSLGLVEFANLMTQLGRFEEAVDLARKALEIDRLDPMFYNELGWALFWAGQEDAALALYQDALQIDPAFVQTNTALADLYLAKGEIDKAIPYIEAQDETIEQQSPTIQAIHGMQCALAGREHVTLELLSRLQERAASSYVQPMAFVYLYLGLRDYDEASKWLEAAYADGDASLVWLKYYWYDGVREDPRVQALQARMNFPD